MADCTLSKQTESTSRSHRSRDLGTSQFSTYTRELATNTPIDQDGEEEGRSDSSDSSQEASYKIDPLVMEDIVRFEESFKGITERFKLLDRIGEGTFSTVYKAEDLLYDAYLNEWDAGPTDSKIWSSPRSKKEQPKRPGASSRYVAIKKIYATSSPLRIQNELELLNDLKGYRSICPLITAFRFHDQVIAVLPYYEHHDFREFFRTMLPSEMQVYFRSLFTALAAVHEQGIIHRDIKPTNFLYDYKRQRGVLVDFGLAEREGTDASFCICVENTARRRTRVENSYALQNPAPNGYPKSDTRPSRRANRAGTRGFRAPEVLLKCTSQTTKIDVWSAGVILLTMLSRRFPFFNSMDDVDALIEISCIFGQKRMKNCALLHGTIFECTLPTIGDKGYPFEKLIMWSTCRPYNDEELLPGERLAIKFLERCVELDPRRRMSAEEALQHEFLVENSSPEIDEDEMDIIQ